MLKVIDMLSKVSKKGAEILESYGKIDNTQIRQYEYGFELLISTISTLCTILILGLFGGYISHAIIFLLYFVPIRIAAGGYHAKSYGRCFILTNIIAIACVVTSRWLWIMESQYVEFFMVTALVLVYKYIWDNAPIIPAKYRGKTKRYDVNRRYAHNVLIIEVTFLVFLKFVYNRFTYTAIVTSYMVAIMMKLAKKGGE